MLTYFLMQEKVSYQTETQEVDVGNDSFCQDIINKAKSLGFSHILEPVCYKGVVYDSAKLNADFSLALRAGQAGLIKEAYKYAKSHKKFDKDWPGLIRNDLFTEMAARFGLKGMYKRRDASPEEQADYEKFAEFFGELKSKYFTSYVQEQWKTRPSKLWKPVAVAAAGLALLVSGAYASYHHYLKPDIKNELQLSASETIDSAIDDIRPELKKEIQQLMPDFDKMYDSFIARAKPELNEMLDAFKDDIKKEFVEIYRAETKAYNDNFEANLDEAIERVMKKRGLDKLLKMFEGK